ncbi:MAG: glycosyltransferase family 2 protein [Gammaproteobacteria bacterium]
MTKELATLNIVIPMAGAGSRFAKAGYQDPKPLIPVCGKPMIEIVVENLRPSRPHHFIFICQQTHIEKYDLKNKLKAIAPNCSIIEIQELTEGAACTVLESKPIINNNNPLMIANSDQYIDYSIDSYLEKMERENLDGLIMTMKANDPKWSFVGFDDTGNNVSRVAEKQVISNEATVGIYNFAHGSDFVSAAEQMIKNNERVNGEFYVAPVYNTLIAAKKYNVGTVNIGKELDGMYGLGIPADLNNFLTTDIAKTLVEHNGNHIS